MEPRNPTTLAARAIETFDPRGDLPQTFPKGRLCKRGAAKCPPGTTLSIYNPGDECASCNPTERNHSHEDFASLMAEAPSRA